MRCRMSDDRVRLMTRFKRKGESVERTATVAFATRSPREFPIAKIVNPKIASEIPKM